MIVTCDYQSCIESLLLLYMVQWMIKSWETIALVYIISFVLHNSMPDVT
jgi:hypothetical protein